MYKFTRKYQKFVALFLTTLMLFSLVGPQFAKASTTPVTLAKWDFSNGSVLVPATSTSENGSRTLSTTGAAITGYSAGPTTGISVANASPWTNEPSFWEVSLSTKGYQNIKVSSKQASSNTGPKDFKLQYSLDRTNWLDVSGGNISLGSTSSPPDWSTGSISNISLPATANDQDNIYVRWYKSSNIAVNGSAVAQTGTSRMGEIVIIGESLGGPVLEKTATPDVSKITYASYTSVTGAAGAVAANSTVTIDDGSTTLGTDTAAADGSFTVTITNPQYKSAVNVSNQGIGKAPSDKVSVSYTGTSLPKSTSPNASKITYASYTSVSGAAGAVPNGSTVKIYFDDNTVQATTTAGADGSFTLAFANPQSKTTVNLTALETGKTESDKVAINYSGTQNNSTVKAGDVVFSQLYVNGGNGGAFYKTKFFELYNNTDKDIDLSSWSIAYTSASTMNFSVGQPLSGTIKAHGYFLVTGGSGTNGQELPVKADATTSLNPSGSTGGALVLANKKTAVTGVDDPNAIDLLAYTNGTAVYKNPLYWGSPISDSTIGGGTIQRKTDIGSDPRSAYGLGNGWFTKDPSKDFVLNKPSGANYAEEMVVHNSAYMTNPNASKITFTKANGTSTIVGQAGAVPYSATVKAYVESNGTLTSQQTATAQADGSFTLSYADSSNNTLVYLTHTDSTQPTAVESGYARINMTGTASAVTSLSELRKNDAKGFTLNGGYKTTIEGVASTNNMPSSDVKTSFYLQDGTGAINVVNNLDPSIAIQAGNKYSVDGRVVFTAGLTQFVPTAIRLIGPDTVPSAQNIAISSLDETNESKLVSFAGKVTNIPSDGPNYDITVSDAAGTNLAIVRLQSSTGIELGATYTFTGTVNQYKKASPFTSGYFLLPRSTSDVKGQLVLTHTPITKAYIGLDVNFSAVAKNADSVTLYYKGANDTNYQSVIMTSADKVNYNGKILQANVPQDKFYYYIAAVNSDDNKSVGTSENPNLVNVVEDKDGPAFSKPSPAIGDKIDSMHPTISVKLDDPNGVNASTTTISIDGKDFTSKATNSETEIRLVLTPDEDLAVGPHTVTVSAKDKLGNVSTYSWDFSIAERFISGNHYRGTTHNHTNISHDAAGSPEDALKAAQKYHYDYFAYSDHSHDIDASLVNQDTVDHGGMKERTGGSDWKLTKDLAKQYTKDGSFVVFPAFEMTSTTWGHSNVFGTDNFIDRVVDGGAYQNLQKYYSWVLTYDNIVAQFNHPKMSANAFDNFIPYDKNLDKLFTMLEVGNGSGKYSYANAEDKYYSALDLGWHVSPTYGEDNHDATWGQTKKRTVIVAKDLTNDSLMDAMRNMRVYMSEDPNFQLDVTASGFYMGSTVDTDTLNFNITGSDPVLEKASDPDYSYIKTTSDDAIAKVELITNGGRVIQTKTPDAGDTSFNWQPSLTVAGGQQWFVVKVTQKDGDQIYSSPIWSQAKDLAVKVSDVATTDGAIIGGLPANLTAGVSNQGTIDVKQITAKFYYDSIDTDHLIGTTQIDSLPSNTSASASVTWTSPVAGTHNIIVVLTAADGHDLGDNKYQQSFMIKAPLNKVIMIDGSHGNENSKQDPGTYKDNFKLFTTLMKQQGYTVAENASSLTDQILTSVSVLVITHPASAYTTSEIAAINNFVKNGGSLLATEKSSFGGTNQNLNDVLAGVGSSILVNNDGVFDETHDGNFWGTPLTANYAVRLHPTPLASSTLTDFVPTIEYYSGSSLAKNDGSGNKAALTDSDTVKVLVSGNESTFQDSTSVKSDTVQYNVQTSNGKNGPALEGVTGGSSIPMIASEQVGKGRVFVSGMNIFNDKQMDQTYNPKGNDPFAVNVVNWLANLEPNSQAIGNARKLTEGTNVVVHGTVTAISFFDAVYVQDETGGIMAFNDVPAGSLTVGDKIRVYGHIKVFENNLELEFGSFADSIVKLGAGTPIGPKVLSTKDSNLEENQGQLVKVTGKVVSKYDDNSYILDDGSGPTLVFTDGYVVNQSGPVPNLTIGDTLEAVGLTGKFSDGNRIRVRDTKELIGTVVSDTTAPAAPVVNGVTDGSVVLTGTAEAGATVVAKVNGQEIGHATADTEGKFSITIAKQAAGTKIVITVTDAAGNVSEATEITVTDVTAPAAPVVNGVTDASVVLTGTAEAGATVVAKVNGQEIGHATADTEGKFSITIAKQAAGTKIVITATDAAGNVSEATEITVTDVTAPAAPVVNGVTDASVVLTGTAEAGATVVAKVNGQEIGHATADIEGKFSITIAKQAAGTKIVITATDAAGNVSEATEITVTDVTAPAAPVVNGVTDADVVVSGIAEAGATVVAKVNGQEIGHATANENGQFTILIAKQLAGTKIVVTATDSTGNVSEEAQVTVTDGTAPVAPVVNGVTDADTVLTGTAEAGATVVAKVNGQEIGQATVSENGQFTISITKQVAGTKIILTATDVAGNVSTTTEVTVSKTAEEPVVKHGWVFENSNWYFFNETGAMTMNTWVSTNGKWYYLGSQGSMLTNAWVQTSGKWYYVGSAGAMSANAWVQTSGKWYYVGSTGAMSVNVWIQNSGKWYYVGSTGTMSVNAWVQNSGKWYFVGAKGAMMTNAWVLTNGKWYYVSANGAMKANAWVLSNGKWYYMDGKGVMQTGWVLVNKKWYFLYADGHMAVNTTIGKYKVGSDGAWIQ